MNLRRILSALLLVGLFCCASHDPADRVVEIKTSVGNIKIKLYNDTPLHRDNFIKLIKSGFYNDLLFHRVIKDFMIQGGDPNSRTAKPGVFLGEGDAGYTLPAEILPNHFHVRGALAAAREGDNVNPQRRSSGAQFYIVQGKKFTEAELNEMEAQLNARNFQQLAVSMAGHISDSLSRSAAKLPVDSISNIIYRQAQKVFKPLHYSEAEKKAYEDIGGVPHLDGAYTVFGEVIEGLDVVEKISLMPTDANNRPIRDIKMTIKIID